MSVHNKTRIAVTLRDEKLKELDRLAHHYGLTKSQMIERLMEFYENSQEVK